MTAATHVPSHVPEDLVVAWDHYDHAALQADPVGCYDALRSRGRAFWSPLLGGFWVLTRYDDVRAVLQDPEVWSSRDSAIPAREVRLLPVNLDPPEHTKYRRIVNGPFSPTSVAGLEEDVRGVTRALMDEIEAGLADGDEVDLLEDFAKPLPSRIFCAIFGLPVDQWREFVGWTEQVLHSSDLEARAAATAQLRAYLAELIVARREAPRDDLLSLLVAAEVDGVRLTDAELVDFAHTLFTAGLDTVTNAIAFVLRHLGEHPRERRRLVDEPDLAAAAVEEYLRLYGFVQLTRTATRDTTVGGVQVRRGERVLLPLASAGRDETEFGPLDEVDLERHPNRHLAFGAGPHRCVGSHLARLELQVVVQEWHARFPAYEVVPPGRPVGHGGGVAGLTEVRLRIERPA